MRPPKRPGPPARDADGSTAPSLGSEPLSFLAALHGFTGEQMYEARRVLEVAAAGLAAERATPDQIASLADEVASLFERMDDPLRFLNHDITFHRIVAEASANPIIGTLVETVSALYYDRRRRTAEQASDRDLMDAAHAHRRIYQAIRAHDADAARLAMHEHLLQAAAYQAQEAAARPVPHRIKKRRRQITHPKRSA